MEGSGQADELLKRFLNEAKAAGNLNHSSIIRIYDADEQDGTAYIAMEFVEGEDLSDRIEKKGRPSLEEAIELCATICDALDHAHKEGVVHRDIKPANIMMLKDGSIRVADFGIAHLQDSELTATGQMIGTPHYMSPEQFQGQKVEGTADLFSVGVMLYEMATGEKPFPGENLQTVMNKVTMQAPIQPKHLNVQVPSALDAVLMKSLSKAPMERYRTGKDMAAALRECLRENPDENILKVKLGGGDSGAATIVGGGATDATLVPGAATVSMEKTAAGPAPSSTVETVVEPKSAANVSTAETIPGNPPAGVELEPVQSSGPSIGLMAGGGVGVIALIGIAVFAFMGGETEPTTGGGESTQGTGTSAAVNPDSGTATAAPVENQFEIVFRVYKETEGLGYSDLNPENYEKFDLAEGAKVRFVDPNDPSTDIREPVTIDGAPQGERFKSPLEKVRCLITLDGYYEEEIDMKMKTEETPIEDQQATLLLAKIDEAE